MVNILTVRQFVSVKFYLSAYLTKPYLLRNSLQTVAHLSKEVEMSEKIGEVKGLKL